MSPFPPDQGEDEVAAFAIYTLDIGVYNLGKVGQVLNSTTAAWARVVDPVESIDELTYRNALDNGEFRDNNGHSWRCGRRVGDLATHMSSDLESGFTVALGFEAPMWFPLVSQEKPGLKLFSTRFDKEDKREWYLQSGAAATLKAIGLGHMALSMLVTRQPDVRFSTEIDSDGSPTVVLFEAFVSAGYKVAPPAELEKKLHNLWDAFTGCLAWGAINQWRSENLLLDLPDERRKPKELHEAGSYPGEVFSVWQSIAGKLEGKRPTICGPADCQVVGLSKQS